MSVYKSEIKAPSPNFTRNISQFVNRTLLIRTCYVYCYVGINETALI